jgi:3',5'-cyclic AMP phosphodiesterase CpdA
MRDNRTPAAPRRRRAALAGILLLTAAALLAAALGGASRGPDGYRPSPAEARTPVAYPALRFAVLSDTHFYDPALGTRGPAWEAYMAQDRKLLADSAEALDVALARVAAAKPDFLIVTGDLTKDGERQDHELVARRLGALAAAGIGSYVIPGNHDIANPEARRFLPSGKVEAVPSISSADFAAIYAGEGYGSALYRDPASLSYVAEPKPGLWLLLLDSAEYEGNAGKGRPEIAGAIREPTFRWIEDRLDEAARGGIAVVAALHHPIMEHYAGMGAKYPKFVLDDNWRLAGLLASRGVRLAFTGHFHANSVVERAWDDKASPELRGRRLVDVETGSLVTWPCSYRMVGLFPDGSAAISTSRVDRLPSYAAAGRDFGAEGRRTVGGGIATIAAAKMRDFKVSRSDSEAIAPRIAEAMMAHYAGDARFEGGEMVERKGLGLMGRVVLASYGTFLRGLWKAVPPAGVALMEDNDLLIAPDGAWARTGP